MNQKLTVEGAEATFSVIVGSSAVLTVESGVLSVDDFEGNSYVVAAGQWVTASLNPIEAEEE